MPISHFSAYELGAYTGKGVVVGVVDGGFQYSHVDFTNPDGIGTRIARVWDQNANGGKAPSKFGYGSEYVTYDEMRAVNYDISSTFHGSHVAGIAAGSDRTTPYYGPAIAAKAWSEAEVPSCGPRCEPRLMFTTQGLPTLSA